MAKHRKTGKTEHQYVTRDEGYEREQALVEVTFTCEICGRTQTRQQLPGAVPTVCPSDIPSESSECQKKANYERVKRWREKHREEANQRQRDYRRRKKINDNISR